MKPRNYADLDKTEGDLAKEEAALSKAEAFVSRIEALTDPLFLSVGKLGIILSAISLNVKLMSYDSTIKLFVYSVGLLAFSNMRTSKR